MKQQTLAKAAKELSQAECPSTNSVALTMETAQSMIAASSFPNDSTMSEHTMLLSPTRGTPQGMVPFQPKLFAEMPMDIRLHINPDALRCAVPVHMGGLGGEPEDLSPLISHLCEESPSAALLFWAQRMAIEFLVRAENVGLWAAAGFKDTLLRWSMKQEIANGNEKAIQPGVQG